MQNTENIDETEIDLHKIVEALWKARLVIISVTLGLTFLAFAISTWLLPRKYIATAYVFIGQPVISISDPVGFSYQPTLPDIKSAVKLATSPGLLNKVIKDANVVKADNKNKLSVDVLNGMVTADDIGKDQISLQVEDVEPHRAELLANTLAVKFSDTLNSTYGLGSIAQTLDAQVLQAQQDYDQAQSALEQALSTSQSDVLQAQRDSEYANLVTILSAIVRTNQVLNDLNFFEENLKGVPGETPLSLGDGISLTNLRQRALTTVQINTGTGNLSSGTNNAPTDLNSMPGIQIAPQDSIILQIDSGTFSNLTTAQALDTTARMETALEIQLTQLSSQKKQLDQAIPLLQKDLENSKAQLNLLIAKRDQASMLYNSLTQQHQRINIVLQQSAKIANVSLPAVSPEKASTPKILINTVSAGAIGLVFSVFLVFFINWWNKENN